MQIKPKFVFPKMKMKMKMKKQEELVETAMAATATLVAVTCVKHVLPHLFRRWVAFATSPSPFLFVLVHLVVASIVLSSAAPRPKTTEVNIEGVKSGSGDDDDKRASDGGCSVGDAEEGGDVEELNARVEAFIVAFRRQLAFDHAVSGRGRRSV